MNELTTTSAREAAAVGAVAGSMFAFIMFFGLAMWVISVIATWKIFKKAGEPGWKAIIPIYNIYMLYKIVGMKMWFWILICTGILLSIIMGVDGTAGVFSMTNAQLAAFNWNDHMLTVVTLVIYCIFALGVDIYYCIRTSKSFNHGGLFATGLFFFQPIFWLILGFGKSKYNKKVALN